MFQQAVGQSPDNPDQEIKAGGPADRIGCYLLAVKDIEDNRKGDKDKKTQGGKSTHDSKSRGDVFGMKPESVTRISIRPPLK